MDERLGIQPSIEVLVVIQRNKLAVYIKQSWLEVPGYLKLVIYRNWSFRLCVVVLLRKLFFQIALPVAVQLRLILVDAPLLDNVALFNFKYQKSNPVAHRGDENQCS